MTMIQSDKTKAAAILGPYIITCYAESHHCDLILISSDNKFIRCHKIVLCSLSARLLSICTRDSDATDTAIVHLPDFTHEEVRTTMDELYSCLGKAEETKIPKTALTDALGIEETLLGEKAGTHSLIKNIKKQPPDSDVEDLGDPAEGVHEEDYYKCPSNLVKIEVGEGEGGGFHRNDKKRRLQQRGGPGRPKKSRNVYQGEYDSEDDDYQPYANDYGDYDYEAGGFASWQPEYADMEEDSMYASNGNSAPKKPTKRGRPKGSSGRGYTKKDPSMSTDDEKPKGYSCEPCDKFYKPSNKYQYHKHMATKHGVPNPMANTLTKRERVEIRRQEREARGEMARMCAEELLAMEKDPEVLELHRQFTADEEGAWSPPKRPKKRLPDDEEDYQMLQRRIKQEGAEPERETTIDEALDESEGLFARNRELPMDAELLEIITQCRPVRFNVKRAGSGFHMAPKSEETRNKEEHFTWKKLREPGCAAIVGVARSREYIDPRIVPYNGDLLVGKPLAWSFPQGKEDMNTQYDAVTRALTEVFGFSGEDVHCSKIFLISHFGGTLKLPKDHRDPKLDIYTKMSEEISNLDIASLKIEMAKYSSDPAGTRKTKKPTFNLEHDRCKLRFDHNLETQDFEGVMLLAWHTDGSTDGNPIGKVLNFDDYTMTNYKGDRIEKTFKVKELFMRVLRDVWTNGRRKLPFSYHMLSCYRSVYERALAPRLIEKVLGGDKTERMCPHCGEVFPAVSIKDNTMYNHHVKQHSRMGELKCGCKDVDNLVGVVAKERHVKLHHSDGKYVQCPKCVEVILKSKLEEHFSKIHVPVICQYCGADYPDK